MNEANSPFELTASDASKLIRQRTLSAVALTQAYLDRIEEFNPAVNAFSYVMPSEALRQARAADARIAAGEYAGPLHGMCFAVKDQLDVIGAPSHMRGSKMQLHDRDATVVARLKAAGAICLGKLVMTGQPGVSSPRNPWDLERAVGGSSSGSAAAVAAQLCSLSLGEDSAGSVRNPAALCGLVGAICSYGRVSRFGLASMGWTIDHCGPLAWCVRDAASVLDVIVGYDPRDPTTVRRTAPRLASEIDGSEIRGTRIGVPYEAIRSSEMEVDGEVAEAFFGSLSTLSGLGAEVMEVELPFLELANFVAFVIYVAESYAGYADDIEWMSLHARERVGRMGFGALTSAGDYLKAQTIRSQIQAAYHELFEHIDLLAIPSFPTTAERARETAGPMGLWWAKPTFSSISNLAGLPAISIPCGFDANGLPIGLQLNARPFDEVTMFKVAQAYEDATPWHERRPVL